MLGSFIVDYDVWEEEKSKYDEYLGSFESTVENHLNTIKEMKTLDEYRNFILSRVEEHRKRSREWRKRMLCHTAGRKRTTKISLLKDVS
jgi:poly-beta-hydroxyalkanoate depolymerase